MKVLLTYGGTTVDLPDLAAKSLIANGNATQVEPYSDAEKAAVVAAHQVKNSRMVATATADAEANVTFVQQQEPVNDEPPAEVPPAELTPVIDPVNDLPPAPESPAVPETPADPLVPAATADAEANVTQSNADATGSPSSAESITADGVGSILAEETSPE